MIGQMSLFKPNGVKLRNRVELLGISVAQARYTIETFHYLHRVRTGRQINYAVMIDGVCDGVITYAYPMMSASLHGVQSDQMLEFARLYLASNIPHSASCAVGKSLKVVKHNWVTSFPDAKEPLLVVSWSDNTRHKGTIYKASNFIHDGISGAAKHGNSKDSKRGSRVSHSDYLHDKNRWIYWLR